MKFSKAVVLSPLAILACTAHAQSSVTLYGTIDEGLDYFSNYGGHSLYALATNYQQLGTRWGIKGKEDLGGGVSAIFQLENGFSVNNGSAQPNGQMFGRQAYVGVDSNRIGALTLGRQYDSVVDYLSPLSAAGSWGGSLFAHPFDADNINDTFRIDNSVKYTSADYAGVQFGGLYGFSNQAGAFANNRAWSIGARYRNGPLAVAAAFMNLDGAHTNTTGAVIESPYTAARQRIAGAGASYAIGSAVLGLLYTHTDIVDRFTFPASTVKFDNVEVNAKYDVSAAWYLAAMYLYTFEGVTYSGGRNSPHRNQVGLMADYRLSKRTDLYVQGVYAKASGNEAWGAVGTYAESTSNNQTVARVGIRTSF
ncbi:porin [Burkholderia lata]|uniref:porin n=1 Tax=Burkholderia lata (strain ATCC 17760 / DSM 23089 / LMG 22485 / NCIMB 9086 / R18194 / 383) TaxID=482957 RepID=UPI00145454CA|nr:porin [Burkholderia lata]VWB81427.1 porin [Burkholderia lata]